ncbi:MAG TPA: hypothetical protein V6C58_03575 [Allocoleopsis sp.]
MAFTTEQAKLTNPYITDYKPVNFNPIGNPISPYKTDNGFNPINTTNYDVSNQLFKADQEGLTKLIDGGKGAGDYISRTLANQQDEAKHRVEQFDANRKYEDQQRQFNHDFVMRNPGFNSGIGTTDIRKVFGGDKNTTFTYSTPVSQQSKQPQPKSTIESSANKFNQIAESNPVIAQPVANAENKLLVADNPINAPTTSVNNTAQNNVLLDSQNNNLSFDNSGNNMEQYKNYFDTGYFKSPY